MKYWLQTQAPAGNWVDSLGTDDLESALSHSDYLQDSGKKTRIVTRVDKVVSTKKKAIRRNPLSAHAAAIMGTKGKTRRKTVRTMSEMTAAQKRAYRESDPARQWVKRMHKVTKPAKRAPLFALQVKIGAKPWTIIGKHNTLEKAKADGIRLHKYLPNAAFRVVTI